MAETKKVLKDDYHIQDQKHAINQQLVDIIKFRQNKKWYISISVVALFSTILALMIYFMSNGVDGKLGEEPAGPHLLKKKKKKDDVGESKRRSRLRAISKAKKTRKMNLFSKSQLDTLRKQYSTIKGINPSSPTYKKLTYTLDSLPLPNLKQLEKAKIPFVSGLARNRVYRAKKFGSTTGG